MNLKLFVFLFAILSLRFYFSQQNQLQLTDGQRISFESTILSQPQIIGNQQVFTANHENQKIRIATGRFPEINYGDFVLISGPISNKGNRVLMYFPEISPVNSSSNIFQSGLEKINILRQNLVLLFSKTLPSPAAGLMLGIIFGIKEQMPGNFSDNLKTSGVFHVVAASGMNVTLVGGFISTLFAFFLKRQIAIGLSILGIVFYAVLAGLEPSIIRASIMGILVFSAQILGRQALAVNGLLLAGFGMLFIDPISISDVGFQLSFMATLGLILIPKIRTIGKIGVIGDNVNSTIAAQIATLPILLANFGTYSLYSIFVNGLVLWTIPIIMMLGGLGALLGLILVPLGQIFIYLGYPLLLYFEIIVNFFGKIGGVISISALSWQFIVGYYCLLASALIIIKKKK